MEKPSFPRRFFSKGSEPASEKSIGYYSNNTKLFESLVALFTDDEWAELEGSPLGVFFRFARRTFNWASMIVKCILTCQIACNKPFEIWSVVGHNPVRFSLNEFAHITGLNCEYTENLQTPSCADVDEDEFSEFWHKLGVPLTSARESTATPLGMAKLVMDLEEFEAYPWGRVAFLNLIQSVKSANLSKHYVLCGFVEVLQLWTTTLCPPSAKNTVIPMPLRNLRL
ncbi:unnamed protein product [Microthlaspi erraticum]|uniref:DUF1985 domain-containing protein n=1 Tax=Microthlaspi erraticum TaxID=1685480 RepID=A0A6D2LE09_9BRAS|nr:unnamed protein product [Microthlaspi erraticum]